jgi:hypothetical protein
MEHQECIKVSLLNQNFTYYQFFLLLRYTFIFVTNVFFIDYHSGYYNIVTYVFYSA